MRVRRPSFGAVVQPLMRKEGLEMLDGRKCVHSFRPIATPTRFGRGCMPRQPGANTHACR